MAKITNSEINGNKYYRARLKIGTNSNGKNIYKNFYGSGKKEAEKMKKEYKDNLEKGLKPDYNKILFGKTFNNWFDIHLTPGLADSTYMRYETLHRLHIMTASFYNYQIINVDSDTVARHLSRLKSKHTAERVYILLASFFKYCSQEGLVTKNPMLNVNIPKYKKPFKKEYLTLSDIKAVKEEFKINDEIFIYVFDMLTGCRVGELLSLTYKDCDIDNLVININKGITRKRVNGKIKYVVDNTKNYHSIRTIPFPKNLLHAFNAHKEKERAKHIKRGMPFSDNCYVFTSEICTKMRGDRLNDRWKKLQEQIGIEVVTFHNLRHTCCTLMAREGIHIKTASLLMGHKDIKTTIDIYTHIEKEQKIKAVADISHFID